LLVGVRRGSAKQLGKGKRRDKRPALGTSVTKRGNAQHRREFGEI
jgi:hypothetical protein